MIAMDLRDKKKSDTEKAIRMAAVDLVLDLGLENVTAEMVARKAGISNRSFFNYFAFKEEALFPSSLDLSQDAVDRFLAATGPLLADLTDLLVTVFDRHEPDRDRLRGIFELACTSPKLVLVRDQMFLRQEKQIGAIVARRLGVDPEDERPVLISAVVAAAIRVAMKRWARGQGRSAQTEVRRSLAALGGLFETSQSKGRA